MAGAERGKGISDGIRALARWPARLHPPRSRSNVSAMTKLLPALFAMLLPVASLLADPPPSAAKNVSINEAEKIIKEDPKVVVLDVRTPDEFKAGHIAGAKNIDFEADDFAQQIGALDKSKTYVVHCAAGGRSAQACKIIEQVKLPAVYHMNEGFKAWEKAGKPVGK
jgi:phage shock protein E